MSRLGVAVEVLQVDVGVAQAGGAGDLDRRQATPAVLREGAVDGVGVVVVIDGLLDAAAVGNAAQRVVGVGGLKSACVGLRAQAAPISTRS